LDLTVINTFLAFVQAPRARLRTRYLIILVLFLSALNCHASLKESPLAPRIDFKAIKPPGIEALGPVNAITQDQRGFMWFAGTNGLARYDGHFLKFYRHQGEDANSISGSFITDLFVDSQGRMWVTAFGGINRYRSETDDFVVYNDKSMLDNPLSIVTGLGVIEDDQQQIWFMTDAGLYRYDANVDAIERVPLQMPNGLDISTTYVVSIYQDRLGFIWLGGSEGVGRYHPKTEEFKYYPDDPQHLTGVSTIDLFGDIYQDSLGRLWFGTDSGLYLFHPKTETFTRYIHSSKNPDSLSHNIIFGIAEDNQGFLWIATDGGGLNRVPVADAPQGCFTRYQHKHGDANSVGADKVQDVFQDKVGDFWFGHFPYGVSKVNNYSSAFTNYRHLPLDENSLSSSAVISLAETEAGNLWVGTEKGLNLIERETGIIKRYMHDPDVPSSLNKDPVISLLYDSQQQLWVGTWKGGLSRFDPATEKFIDYRVGTDYETGSYWSMYEDSKQGLWFGSGEMLSYYDQEHDRFVDYISDANKPDRLLPGWVRSIFEDSSGRFWVGTGYGLTRLHRDEGVFEHYYHRGEHHGASIRVIFEDAEQQLWIGLEARGLNKMNSDFLSAKHLPQGQEAIERFEIRPGVRDEFVSGILSDDEGYLWLSTRSGLERFDPRDNSTRGFGVEHGLAGELYNRQAYLKSRSGEMIFGSTEGLSIFRPENVFYNTVPPEIVLTEFALDNTPVVVGAKGSPLQQAIHHSSKITLAYEHRIFSISFAALNYRLSEYTQYAYKLEGFDSDWVYAGSDNRAIYTNIDDDTYLFRVKSVNSEGLWSEAERHLTIVVESPWWANNWSKTFYAVLLVALCRLIMYTGVQKKRAEYERRFSAKLRDLDKVKSAFFANTSHELRTPLNGMIGLSEAMLAGASGEISPPVVDNLKLIVHSSKRLAYLINDILDFSKLKDHSIDLHYSQVDLSHLVEMILALTQPLVNAKPLTLSNLLPESFPQVLVDEQRLQQILYNLVGNAIKFTKSGSVSLSASIDGEYLSISVTDTGIGIAEDKINQVFAAFEQVSTDPSSESRQYGGTGLGLVVCKQLVELHGGDIKLSSALGEGTTASFRLKMAQATSLSDLADASGGAGSDVTGAALPALITMPALPAEPTSKALNGIEDASNDPNLPKKLESDHDDNKRYHILLVDDEMVNRQVLINLLSLTPHRVSACADAEQAELLLKDGTNPIDLVILDVMMPGISGYQLCKKIRQHHSIEQLPILFLTAKSQVHDLQEGYAVGGNDYLNKPVAKEELFARIDTQLALLQAQRDLKESLAQLKSAQSQLVHNEKMSSLSTLVRGMAHEINNPANMAHAGMFNLDKELHSFQETLEGLIGPDDQEVLELFNNNFSKLYSRLAGMREGTTRIKELVEGLRLFSCSDEENNQAEVSLSLGIKSSLAMVKGSYSEQVIFDCRTDEDLKLLCNSAQLNQALMNVMVNACMAIVDKQKEQIVPIDNAKPQQAEKGTLKIRLKHENDQAVIIFIDDGCGMSEKTQKNLFEPFFTTRVVGHGAGLGMSIAFSVVDQHGGRIEVESVLGEGTVVSVYLPLTRA